MLYLIYIYLLKLCIICKKIKKSMLRCKKKYFFSKKYSFKKYNNCVLEKDYKLSTTDLLRGILVFVKES